MAMSCSVKRIQVIYIGAHVNLLGRKALFWGGGQKNVRAETDFLGREQKKSLGREFFC